MNRQAIQETLGRILTLLERVETSGHPDHEPDPERPTLLTPRQLEVLRCAARGASVADTAHQLHMSVSTVKNHRQAIRARLRVANVSAAIHEAGLRGLLP